jgi:hypothetical protein
MIIQQRFTTLALSLHGALLLAACGDRDQRQQAAMLHGLRRTLQAAKIP